MSAVGQYIDSSLIYTKVHNAISSVERTLNVPNRMHSSHQHKRPERSIVTGIPNIQQHNRIYRVAQKKRGAQILHVDPAIGQFRKQWSEVTLECWSLVNCFTSLQWSRLIASETDRLFDLRKACIHYIQLVMRHPVCTQYTTCRHIHTLCSKTYIQDSRLVTYSSWLRTINRRLCTADVHIDHVCTDATCSTQYIYTPQPTLH